MLNAVVGGAYFNPHLNTSPSEVGYQYSLVIMILLLDSMQIYIYQRLHSVSLANLRVRTKSLHWHINRRWVRAKKIVCGHLPRLLIHFVTINWHTLLLERKKLKGLGAQLHAKWASMRLSVRLQEPTTAPKSIQE